MLDKLRAPLSAGIEITSTCNFNCIHCYNDKIMNVEMNIDEFSKIISLFDSLRIFDLHICGGEPLCHKNFRDICEVLKSAKLSAILITNGYKLKDYSEIINETFKKVHISIDGPEAIHNKIRGQNCFRAIIDNLSLINIRKVMCTTVTRFNYNYVDASIRVAIDHGFDAISFFAFKPIGKGFKNKDALTVDETELEELSFAVKNWRSKYNFKINYINPLAERCYAGKEVIYILPDGMLKPCAYSKFLVGNILHDNWEMLWKKSQDYPTTCHAF